MSEFKGTKGKWSVSPEYHYYNGNKALEINYGNDGECVAEVVHDDYDAKLISKAPEMLESLQEVIRLRDLIDYDESIVNVSNIGEASAILQMLNKIETLIKEATEL